MPVSWGGRCGDTVADEQRTRTRRSWYALDGEARKKDGPTRRVKLRVGGVLFPYCHDFNPKQELHLLVDDPSHSISMQKAMSIEGRNVYVLCGGR